MLGKRGRYPMKRTTSMTDISYDDLSIMLPPPSDHNHNHNHVLDHSNNNNNNNSKVMGFVSPRPMISRRNSADYSYSYSSSSTSFLRTCSLCNRRLAPGRDIFMYRGDSAFCSLECRQQQMTQDEWKEKCTLKDSHSTTTTTTTSTAVPSTKAESIAAL